MKRWFTFVLLASGCAHVAPSYEVLGGGRVSISCYDTDCYEEAEDACGKWGFEVMAQGRTSMLVQCRPPTASAGVSRVAAQ